MKFRNGFVSNSSSSSFVMLGVRVHDNSDELYSKLYKQDKKIRCHEVEDGEVIGYDLARWSDEDWGDFEISQLQIEETLEKLNNLGFKDTEIRMFCGITSS